MIRHDKRIDIRIDETTIQKLDELSERYDMSRSKLIRFLIEQNYGKNKIKTVAPDIDFLKGFEEFKTT